MWKLHQTIKVRFGGGRTPRTEKEVLGAFIFTVILFLKRKMVIL